MKPCNILTFVVMLLTNAMATASNLPAMTVDCPNDFLNAFPVGITADAVKKHYGDPTDITPDGQWVYADYFNDGIDTHGRSYLFRVRYGRVISASVTNVDSNNCYNQSQLLTVAMPDPIRRPAARTDYASSTQTITIFYAIAFFAVAGLIILIVLIETKKATE
jgi:hypothetical protein